MNNDGGPAFPCHTNPLPARLANAPQGMTLRDYFAAHAPSIPTAIIQQDPWVGSFAGQHRGHLQCLSTIEREVWWRYHFADLMLAARNCVAAEPEAIVVGEAVANG